MRPPSQRPLALALLTSARQRHEGNACAPSWEDLRDMWFAALQRAQGARCEFIEAALRGSGALSGYVDILIEMNWFGRPGDDDRRRRLQTYSRYEETPRRLVIELTKAGTDYVSHGDFEEVEFTQSWQPLRLELEGAANRLTLQEIRKQWSGFAPPDEVTLWRWLKRAVALGLVLRDGAGRRNDPFRYWLPGMEEKWRKDPFSLEALGELGDLQAIPGVWPKVPRGKKESIQ